MPIALPALGGLVFVLWVVAFALLAAVILGYVAGVLHGLPFPINQLAGPVSKLAQGSSDVLFKAVHLTERLVGAGFHLLARYLDSLWHQLEFEASVLERAAGMIGTLAYDHSGLRSLVRRLEHVFHGIEHGVKTLNREFHGIEGRLRKLERELTKGIGHDLRIQVAGLENDLTKLERHVIPGLRHGIKAAEGEVTQLENFIKAIPGTKYLEWAAGIVAAAIGIEALNLFRCNTFQNQTAKRGCGLWDGLEKLLGLVGLLAVGFTFQEFVDAASEVAGGIGSFVGDLEQPFVGDLPPLPPPRT